MPQTVTKLRIFLASPGDVVSERAKMDEIIKELNHGIAAERNIVLELVKWETHAWPGFGLDAQKVINEQIGAYDIFLGIMWNRLGTPTTDSASGTVEEFEKAYQLWQSHKQPSLFFYFKQTPANLASIEELDQKRKVIEFRNSLFRLGGLYWEYDSLDGFRSDVTRHLTSEVRKWDKIPTKEKLPSNTEQFCNLDHWQSLTKIGRWNMEMEPSKNEGTISGNGVHSFLLSHNIYGGASFMINAEIKFHEYAKHKNNGSETANAGIIFGWKDNPDNNRYYNVLLTGEYVVLEEIGAGGRDDYSDFRYLTRPAPFSINEGTTYRFLIAITTSTFTLYIDDKMIFTTLAPRSILGKVGIRPWRAKISCEYFEVTSKI